jgi:ATP-binding cassette subfamily B multidrug efflux pump
MLKVLKNLKQSWVKVLVIVALLCLQAACDLELPNYTSKIVNVGIQAGGIEEKIPSVLSKEDYDNLLLFSNDENVIIDSYTLEKSSNNTYNVEKYINEEQEVYVLKNLSEDEENKLKEAITNPVIEISTLKDEETANKIKEQMLANVPEQQKAMVESQDIITLLKQMPKENLNKMLEEYTSEITKMPDSIKEQAVTSGIKKLYKSAGVDTDKLQNNYILIAGLKMLGVASITMISAVSIMLLSAQVSAKLGKILREKVFSKVLTFSRAELNEFSTASLITRSTNDIQQIQQLMGMLFRVLVYAPIIAVGGLIKVFNTDGSMVWVIGVTVLAILFVVAILFGLAMPKFKKLQSLIDKLNQVSREILTGLSVIRAFNKEKTEEKRFDDANSILMKVNIFVNRTMSMMMPLMMVIMNAASVLVIWVGAKGVDNGTMQVGDIMAFIQYMMQIVMSFLMISAMSIMIPRASVSANRINEVLEKKPSIADKKETKKLNPSKKGLVEFKDVSFRYPDADTEILEDISFTAKPGETTAIIGSTGSGKSTIVNLIPRFYDVTEGELLIDGVNVKDLSQKDLRDIIGFVPQKGMLFSGTIESNIKYSDDNMSDEQMKTAAQIAQATEFIEGKDKKYNSEIAQGGGNVSGGQKQRLSIARAIAKNPEIFVFDDSFSALDFKTDKTLREALSEKTKDKTVIIVAQRISTILNADQIIVLEEGKVVGKGTHEELMKTSEVYKQIALSQLSEKELGGEA